MHAKARPEFRARIEATHDAEIAKHEDAALAHRRRVELAGAGLLHHGPDEMSNPDYMREHGGLIAMAQRCGRCRQSSESV